MKQIPARANINTGIAIMVTAVITVTDTTDTSTTFFQAIGKAFKGALLSLTKQVIFLLPLLVILPRFLGVEGVMFAAPISDLIAFCTAVTMLYIEMKNMSKYDIEGG